jgi:hypothetical protein
VQALYQQFLGQPLGHLSHELLHTHYLNRGTRRYATVGHGSRGGGLQPPCPAP